MRALDNRIVFRFREAKSTLYRVLMANLKDIITCYVDFCLGRSGYPPPPSDRDIFEGVLRICAQLQSDVRFSNTLEYFRNGVSRDTFRVVLDQLLIGELNWARVLSIVALSGSLAVQCAEKGEEKKDRPYPRLGCIVC